MHGPVGHAYVYLVYGMHHCLNVVARSAAEPAGAVLIRALEPLVGVEHMRERRQPTRDRVHRLCAGPARVCQALAIDRAFDGHDLIAGTGLWLAPAPRVEGAEPVARGPRIGVGYAGEGWADRPWRFWLAGNRSVSR